MSVHNTLGACFDICLKSLQHFRTQHVFAFLLPLSIHLWSLASVGMYAVCEVWYLSLSCSTCLALFFVGVLWDVELSCVFVDLFYFSLPPYHFYSFPIEYVITASRSLLWCVIPFSLSIFADFFMLCMELLIFNKQSSVADMCWFFSTAAVAIADCEIKDPSTCGNAAAIPSW